MYLQICHIILQCMYMLIRKCGLLIRNDLCLKGLGAILELCVSDQICVRDENRCVYVCRMLESEGGNMVLNDFWPYWMPQSPQTITNSIDMDGMVLLTGCNMGGRDWNNFLSNDHCLPHCFYCCTVVPLLRNFVDVWQVIPD